MRCAVSVPDLPLIKPAIAGGADVIEVRLDLTGHIPGHFASETFSGLPLPLIFTLRSAEEGGLFAGGADEWWEIIRPFLPFATYVDVESRFACHAPRLKAAGKTVIASHHTPSMPDPGTLAELESRLRSYGDIPKIVVSPASESDILSLLSFTLNAGKPVITSIMGTGFRYARLMLPLFGSYLIFCHCGQAASPGQYHLEEWKEFCTLLRDR